MSGETVEQAKQRYTKLLHAMQSGVTATMSIDSGETEPKHLRVGVNSALVSVGALAKMLVDKGIITEDELYPALADAMADDVKTYEATLSKHYGTRVRLS